MEEEITYIPYGQDQISQQELLTNMANDVQNYVDGRAWSKKRKESFLRAYQDIVSKGITGASNSTGVWQINHNGTIDMSNMSQVDKEMYGAAAYFIQNQMSKIKPKVKEEEKKQELEPFDHNTLFNKYIINNQFGGNKNVNLAEQWDYLDDRDATGKRGTKERRNRMIKILEGYRDSIEDNKYSFEDTPFKDINDFRTRINNAITALGTNDEKDDIEAFNKLGLNSRQWFSNGLGDYSGETYTDENGNVVQLTYDQLNRRNDALNKKKQEQLLAEQKAKQQAAAKRETELKANRFNQGTYLSGGEYTSEQDLFKRYSNTNNLIAKLNQLGEKSSGWSDQERLDIAGAFNLYKNNLQNISKEELDQFKGLKDFQNIAPNRIKRIPGVSNFYYDTKTGKIIRPGRKEETATPDSLSNFNPNNRKLSDGWEAEDYLRMGAMAQDITGAITAWAPGYGTAASGILGLTSLGTNMAADIADESLTKWDVAKNAGVNLGLAAVGMVPGLGLASKTGKWLTNIAKWAPRLLTLQAIKDLPESYNSLQKAINNPKELTNADWRNIAYGLSIAAGLSRGAKGIYSNRKYKPAFTENTEKQYTITTSKEKKTITQEQVDNVKKLDFKDKEKANEKLKDILKLSDDETVDIKDLKVLGKTLKTKGVKIEEENIPTGLSAKAKAYREYLENKNNSIKRGEGIYKYAPRFLKTDYDIYKANTQRSVPDLGVFDKVKGFWNPLSDKNLQKKGIKVEEAPKTNPKTTETPKSEMNSKKSWSEIEKGEKQWTMDESMKEWKDILKGEQKPLAIGENFKVGDDFHFNVMGHSGSEKGMVEINFGSKKESIKFENQKDLRKKILKFMKENAPKIIVDGKPKYDAKKMGEILRQLKAKGVFKQGGRLDKQRIQQYKEFIKK